MSVLALKALSYGAEKLPDRMFEAIPGGFFTPEEKRHAKSKTNRRPALDLRGQSEQRGDRRSRRSQRERSPPSGYSDVSGYDSSSDYERDQRRQRRRRRAQSLGRSLSRSPSRSRGRDRQRGPDVYNEQRPMDRDRSESGRGYPPASAEYKPYNPQDYSGGYNDPYQHRPSAAQDPGYPPQVNTAFRSRSATVPTGRPSATPLQMLRSKLMGNPPSNWSSTPPLPTSPTSTMDALRSGTPLHAVFSPSYEPPLAALLYRSATNAYQPVSATAARYTPAAGYAPSPVNTGATAPPPPSTGYAPYNPAEYAAPSPLYHAPGNTYPSPPPFYRQSSRSQPSLAEYPYPDGQRAVAAYDTPPDRQSTSSRRRRRDDDRRHRARSAGHRDRSRSRVTDKFRDRFEGMDPNDKNLAASVGGALAGGLAGRAVGHGTLSTLIGAGIGAFSARGLEKRHDK